MQHPEARRCEEEEEEISRKREEARRRGEEEEEISRRIEARIRQEQEEISRRREEARRRGEEEEEISRKREEARRRGEVKEKILRKMMGARRRQEEEERYRRREEARRRQEEEERYRRREEARRRGEVKEEMLGKMMEARIRQKQEDRYRRRDLYSIGNAGDYDPTGDHYHPIAPSLDSRVSEDPIYHADPYDGCSTGRTRYAQPPGVIAPYGVTGQPLGDYGSQRKSLCKGQQSDDDYQRHNADRNRREGRAQDRFGQRNQRTSKTNEFFVAGGGIHFDVLQREMCKFLGPEASARPATFKGIRGFAITASRPVTPRMRDALLELSLTPRMLDDHQELSMEYTRSPGNSLSSAAEARAIDLGESWVHI